MLSNIRLQVLRKDTEDALELLKTCGLWCPHTSASPEEPLHEACGQGLPQLRVRPESWGRGQAGWGRGPGSCLAPPCTCLLRAELCPSRDCGGTLPRSSASLRDPEGALWVSAGLGVGWLRSSVEACCARVHGGSLFQCVMLGEPLRGCAWGWSHLGGKIWSLGRPVRHILGEDEPCWRERSA